MKILLVFYSRTKTTAKLAKVMAGKIDCDSEEIIDTFDRQGARGYLISGKQTIQKKLTLLEPIKNKPDSYDLVIIGTPVWVFTMSVPIRTYINNYYKQFKQVAFFCTQGSKGHEKTFKHMEELCKQKPIAVIDFTTKQIINHEYSIKLKKFIQAIKT
ncbi:hypothetical protein ISS06_00380 [Patescibacteria group bacterium]|nr:hypothetical protein [Patescibacteria group bacterium]